MSLNLAPNRLRRFVNFSKKCGVAMTLTCATPPEVFWSPICQYKMRTQTMRIVYLCFRRPT